MRPPEKGATASKGPKSGANAPRISEIYRPADEMTGDQANLTPITDFSLSYSDHPKVAGSAPAAAVPAARAPLSR
jgi:hypothetical protein